LIIEVIHLQEGISNATLTAYIPDTSLEHQMAGNRPAVIICPGGAFLGITEKEAEPVALRFLSAGYHAFVLKYSIGADMARLPAPFIDAAKAILLVREHAGRWGVNPDKITLCGFSTGGYVAAHLAATWQEDYLTKALKADNQLFRPNALLLGYPLLDMNQFKLKNIDRSPEMKTLIEMIFTTIYGTIDPKKELLEEGDYKNKITSHMVPTFLWTTSEDVLVGVDESLEFIKVLASKHIPYEFHIFEKGAHGLSLGDQTVGYLEEEMKELGNVKQWVDLALNWLKTI
jgi:acetyl esterase/lipase